MKFAFLTLEFNVFTFHFFLTVLFFSHFDCKSSLMQQLVLHLIFTTKGYLDMAPNTGHISSRFTHM